MRLGIIERLEDIRLQPMPYTHYNGSNGHGPGNHHQHSHSVGGNTATSNFFVRSKCRLQTGQQKQFLHPSQVPRSASQPHNRSLLILSSAGLTFFPWSGVTLYRCFTSLMPHSLIRPCLAACGSSSRPHQTLFAFKSSFFIFTRCITSHFIRLRDQKK